MRTALCVIDIIAKSQNILMEIIGILEGAFYLYAFALPGKCDHITDGLRRFVKLLYESTKSLGLRIIRYNRLFGAPVLKVDSKLGIKIRRLVHTAHYLFFLKIRALKYLGIRVKINLCTRKTAATYYGKHAFIERKGGYALLIMIVICIAPSAYINIHMRRQGVYY